MEDWSRYLATLCPRWLLKKKRHWFHSLSGSLFSLETKHSFFLLLILILHVTCLWCLFKLLCSVVCGYPSFGNIYCIQPHGSQRILKPRNKEKKTCKQQTLTNSVHWSWDSYKCLTMNNAHRTYMSGKTLGTSSSCEICDVLQRKCIVEHM